MKKIALAATIFSVIFMNLGVFTFSISLMLVGILFCINGFKFKRLPLVDQISLMFICILLVTMLSTNFDISYPLYFYTTIYCFLTLAFTHVAFCFTVDVYVKAIKLVVKILLLTLAVQNLYYVLFHGYLDLHYLITLGKYTSRSDSLFMNNFGLIRPTGFSVEPSNYSAIIIYLICCYVILVKRVDGFSIKALMLSCLTFSFTAIAVVLVYFYLYAFTELKNLSGRGRMYLFISVNLFGGFVGSFLYQRMFNELDYDAVSSRLQILSYLSSISLSQILFGNGLLMFEESIYLNGSLVSSSMLRDGGYWINSLIMFGVCGTAIFSALLYKCSKSIQIFLLVAISFMFKLDYMQPIFWMLLFTIVSASSLRVRRYG